MLKTAIFLSTIFVFSSAAFAEPIHLDCMGSNAANKRETFSVNLDEASAKVSHVYSGGASVKSEGVFSANTISYYIEYKSDIKHYVIDRTTLKYRMFLVESGDEERHVLGGNCSVVNVAGRKI